MTNPQSRVTIRRVELIDAREIADLINNAFAVEVPITGDLPETASGVQGEIHEAAAAFAALLQERVVGFVLVRQYTLTPWGIFRLCVRPEFQGQGIGSVLMDAAERFVRDSSQAAVIVSIMAERQLDLQPFYEKRGYMMTDQRRPWRRLTVLGEHRSGQLLLMRKELQTG